MKIEKDRVVRFHYAVAEAGKESVENSKDGGQPLAILFGHGNIIPGLEKAMEGKEAGDSFKANVPAAEAYGERREGLSQRIPKKHFGAQKLEPGMQVVLQTNFGPRAVTIEKVGMSVVDVDLNHPMAGKDLDFDIEIVEVREMPTQYLIVVETEAGEQVFIPFVEDFIVDIDEAEGVIYMDLPAGLVDMSEAEEE